MESTQAQSNTQVVQQAYGYFAKGDIPSLQETLTPDVKWRTPGPKEFLPWVGQRSGRQEVGEFFRQLSESTEFITFEPREFIADGNKVITLGYWEAKSKKTGKLVKDKWVMVFTLTNGKVSNFEEFSDTWAQVEAHR